MSDTPDSEKLKNRLTQMRDRIESLRGLCKTAVGYLRDENAFHQAAEIASLIGDMEPPLNQTLDIVSEIASAQAQRDKAREDALEQAAKVCDSEATCEGIAQKCAVAIRAMKECE